MFRLFSITISIFISLFINAISQPLNVHTNSGRDTTFEISDIDSITFNKIPARDSLIFSDDFENQPLYTFPAYKDWKSFCFNTASRTAVFPGGVMLDNKYKSSGQKSFRVSAPAGHTAFVNQRLQRTPDTVTYELKLYMEKYPDSAFAESSLSFGFWNISESIAGENYAGLVVRHNGNLSCRIGTKESPVIKLDLNRWYIIRLRFEVPSRSLTAWVNLQPVVPKYGGILPSFGYKDFTIQSTNSEAYIDDLKIWESE